MPCVVVDQILFESRHVWRWAELLWSWVWGILNCTSEHYKGIAFQIVGKVVTECKFLFKICCVNCSILRYFICVCHSIDRRALCGKDKLQILYVVQALHPLHFVARNHTVLYTEKGDPARVWCGHCLLRPFMDVRVQVCMIFQQGHNGASHRRCMHKEDPVDGAIEWVPHVCISFAGGRRNHSIIPCDCVWCAWNKVMQDGSVPSDTDSCACVGQMSVVS